MRKFFFFFLIGLALAAAFRELSTQTIIFDGLEKKITDGFFYLREPDVLACVQGRANPYVSNSIAIVGIDNKSLGVLGKWPWYRDVHARFLNAVQRFSPEAVYFDIAFVMPEKVPQSLLAQLPDDPRAVSRIRKAFSGMDSSLADALKKYRNVYIDLFLIGQKRPNSPYLRRIMQTERVMAPYSQAVPAGIRPWYYSLEPLVPEFMANAQPVTVNQWPDNDSVVRSFLLSHIYQTQKGKRRRYFTAVLALLSRFYRLGSKDQIVFSAHSLTLKNALAPELTSNNQLRQQLRDFHKLKALIDLPVSSMAKLYNKNLRNFLEMEYRVIYPDDRERIPSAVIKLLDTGGRYRLLAGREVYDAAVALNSAKVEVVIYHKKDIVIPLEDNYAGVPGFFPINFAGRQEVSYPDPGSAQQKEYQFFKTKSYVDVLKTGAIPDLPAVGANGVIPPAYDQSRLLAWYRDNIGSYSQKALMACRQKFHDLSSAHVFNYIANIDPAGGRFILYGMFFDDIDSLIKSGNLSRPKTIRAASRLYAQWLRDNGIKQAASFRLDRYQILSQLHDIYRGNFDRYYDKIIITGAYSAGMANDIKVTPYGSMFGVTVMANAFSTVATNNLLRRSSNLTNILLLFGLCIMLAIIYAFMNVRINFFFLMFSTAAIFAGSYILFYSHNYVLRIIPMAAANVMVFIVVTVIRIMSEEKDKNFLKRSFSQYISPELIDIMYKNKTSPKLGGGVDVITAYFTDIQSFSTFSEKLRPEQLVELLNEYLSAMTDILLLEKGTLDKYEGDAIIAFFGAPVTMADHALRACRTAVMMQKSLGKLREKWSHEQADNQVETGCQTAKTVWRPGYKWPDIVHNMRMRIGINTGEIVTGNMGSKMRMNYTMIGDSVNLAARLEAAAKQYGIYTLISEYTYNHQFVNDQGQTVVIAACIEARLIDRITVVGKSEPVYIYELAAMKGELTDRERQLFAIFAQAMKLYTEMQWLAAADRFTEAAAYEAFPDNALNPSALYVKRCRQYAEHPPAAVNGAWDRVFCLTQK
ncbi:MAG: CHASE2 domain-containing protein [Deltaproteobacteria bacterium]|nr:CHASE2 domain-containing protein [Deltaproteobacteria bacterium]